MELDRLFGRAQFGRGGIFAPFWRAAGYWKNSNGAVTFPLDGGGWYAGAGKRYVEALPNARLEVVKACGHAVDMEQPETLARLVGNFIAGR